MGKSNHVLKIGGKNLDYENWKVYHPNGRHMFTCGGKKAKWYLDRNLAENIGNGEIMLNFEPNGEGFKDNEEFGRSIREVRCVVTGIDYDMQRHHIIPYCYRTYFPDKYKSKNHHDVVLMNHDIHSDYERHATEFKDQLAVEYGIKTITEYNKAYSQLLREYNRDKTITLSKLISIFRGYKKMNNIKVQQNLEDIADALNFSHKFIKSLNYIQLYKLYVELKKIYAYELQNFQERHRRFYDHGYHLVNKLNTEEKIENFVKLWRKHFIETMQPQYMPEGWSINFRFKTKIK